MSWLAFETDSALERDTLERALPLVETESTGDDVAIVGRGSALSWERRRHLPAHDAAAGTANIAP